MMHVFLKVKEEGNKKEEILPLLPYDSYPNSLCTEKLRNQVRD